MLLDYLYNFFFGNYFPESYTCWLPALIGVAGSLASAGLSFGLSRANMNKQNQQIKERFYEEMNYKAPASQVHRLRQAGLNPALMYSNGNGTGISGAMGSSGLASSSVPDIGSGLLSGLEAKARIDNLNQNTQNQQTENDFNRKANEARLSILSSEALSAKYKSEIDKIDAAWKAYEKATDVKIKTQELNKVKAEIDKIVADTDRTKGLSDLDKQYFTEYVRANNSLISEREANIRKSDAEVDDLKATQPSRIRKNEAQAYESTNRGDKAFYESEILRDLFDNTNFVDKVVERIDSEINKNKSVERLNNENKKYVSAYVLLRAIDTGSDVLQAISSEARGWSEYFLKKTKQEGESKLKTLLNAAGDNVSYEDVVELLQLFANFAE